MTERNWGKGDREKGDGLGAEKTTLVGGEGVDPAERLRSKRGGRNYKRIDPRGLAPSGKGEYGLPSNKTDDRGFDGSPVRENTHKQVSIPRIIRAIASMGNCYLGWAVTATVREGT